VIGGVCQQGLLASRYSPLTRQIDPHWRSEIALLVREYVYAPLMCALPPKADICGALAHVRFGPKADIGCLFDHLISDLLETKRSREAKADACL
jgi:hypothetical protein